MLHGFRLIEEEEDITKSFLRNHRSATENAEATTDIILDEVRKGRYVKCKDWMPDIISPLGLVPKSSGGFRLIHDCSLPIGSSVNDFTVTMDKCKYESVDSAVATLTPHCYMAKVDIKAAFRSISSHPSSYRATGIQWSIEGQEIVLVDTMLPFGARPSPSIFHRISQFVKRVMLRRGFSNITAYQDDFLVVGESYDECLHSWVELITLLLHLGFEINYSKLEAPATSLIFLGIQLDSTTMQLSLPEGKLKSTQGIISEFMGRARATKRQLQSLAGKLCHAAKVIRGGRTFLRRLFSCISKLKRPYHKARIKGNMLKDIQWWHSFMAHFNGVASCIDAKHAQTVVTDSCLIGGGAFYAGDFYYINWELDHHELNSLPINYKEAAMAALSVLRWATHWRNKTVYIYCDNQCAVSIINKCSCRSELVMLLLRKLFWVAAHNNCSIRAIYLPGNLNIIADTVSRLHEAGQLLHLESIVNEWYMCHTSQPCAFAYTSLCNHMSLRALCSIFQHVASWQTLRRRWMH